MKIKTIGITVVVLALLGLGAAGLSKRAKSSAVAPAAVKAAQQNSVELAKTDVLSAQTLELLQGLPISGSIKAANTALVKARVAGELQGLTLREGDPVKAGQVVARVESSEYASRVKQAEDQAAAAKAQIDIAQRSVDNNRALVNQGFISTTALDTSEASLTGAKASHQAALAAVDVAKKSSEDTVLRAPISGVVASRSAQNGERVGIDARVIEIVSLGSLELEAAIATADSTAVRVGQVATLQIEGIAQSISAKVARISPSAQAGSRSVLTYLSLPPAEGLRQGLFAQGMLGMQSLRAVAVPVGAVRTDKPEPYVQVVAANKLVHQKVQVLGKGEAKGLAMLAVNGLAEGTQVLGGHVGSVREGVTVSFTQAPVAAPAAAAAASLAAMK
jgi:RND family efflux transporter MFP subunit